MTNREDNMNRRSTGKWGPRYTMKPVLSIKFDTLADRWLNSIKPQIKESSYIKYHNMLQNHILPYIGEREVYQLKTEVMEEFINCLLTGGRKDGKGGLSKKTVRDILAVLKEIAFYGSMRDIQVPYCLDGIRVKLEAPKMKILTLEDQKTLETYLFQKECPTNCGILMSLYTGIRVGELCALRWKDILADERILKIQYTMQRIQHLKTEEMAKTKIVLSEPKSRCSIRDIPLPGFMAEELKRLKTENEECFFLTGRTDRWIEPRTMENRFKYALRDCGLEEMNFHSLRHTFATRCIEAGFDVKSLSEILGHASVNITLNRYVHSSLEQKRKNMLRLSPMEQKTEDQGETMDIHFPKTVL